MKKFMIFLAVLLIASGAAFYGGAVYAKNKRGSFTGANFRGANAAGAGNMAGFSRGNALVGDIISLDSDKMTIKTKDGSTKIVFFTRDMKITKSTDGAVSDLLVNIGIVASGAANSDGSFNAKTINISPVLSNK